MNKKQTVKKNFQKILAHRLSREGGLTVFGIPGRGRVGVAVAKSVKGAVRRNRIKRHLREFAHNSVLGKTRLDIILVAGTISFSHKPIKFPEVRPTQKPKS